MPLLSKCVEFSLISFGTLKYDCVKDNLKYDLKTIEMLNFMPPINNSVTSGFSFLLLLISAIMSSKTINILRLF